MPENYTNSQLRVEITCKKSGLHQKLYSPEGRCLFDGPFELRNLCDEGEELVDDLIRGKFTFSGTREELFNRLQILINGRGQSFTFDR